MDARDTARRAKTAKMVVLVAIAWFLAMMFKPRSGVAGGLKNKEKGDALPKWKSRNELAPDQNTIVVKDPNTGEVKEVKQGPPVPFTKDDTVVRTFEVPRGSLQKQFSEQKLGDREQRHFAGRTPTVLQVFTLRLSQSLGVDRISGQIVGGGSTWYWEPSAKDGPGTGFGVSVILKSGPFGGDGLQVQTSGASGPSAGDLTKDIGAAVSTLLRGMGVGYVEPMYGGISRAQNKRAL